MDAVSFSTDGMLKCIHRTSDGKKIIMLEHYATTVSKCSRCDVNICDLHAKTLDEQHPFIPSRMCFHCHEYYCTQRAKSEKYHRERAAMPDLSPFSEHITTGPQVSISLSELDRLNTRSKILTSYRKILNQRDASVLWDETCSVPNCMSVSIEGETPIPYNEYINCGDMVSCNNCCQSYCDRHCSVLKKRATGSSNMILCDKCAKVLSGEK